MIEDLIAGFDEELFCDFVNSKFSGSFSRTEREIPEINDFPWDSARQLGIVKRLPGPNNSNTPLLIVAAKFPDGEELKERSSRIKQFRFAKQVLDDAMSSPAPGVEGVLAQGLFVFYDESGNFRLSLVYGKAEGSKLVWSTAKRFSFHVEAGQPNKTFRDRTALDWSSFDKLKEAFSVEKLTREFYTRLFAWYQRAMESDDVVFPNDIVKDKEPGGVKSEQIIRLITRLMFVWFLKQKHLVPNDLFDPERLSDVLQQFDPESGENYYRAILQNLFFAMLNTEIGDRAFAVEGNRAENEEHFGVKIFYRYASEFAVSEKEVIKLFGSIPFMNGGLFECLDRDNHYYDGFSRRKSKRAQVPNALFFDDKGLIPLLSQYNFTVEENSPGDEEVALDPEMLGKVFENLLAAYNPETNTQARKATGSFYTPREIVNYMVDESLKAHVKTKVGWLSSTGIPACGKDRNTGIPACDEKDRNTGIPACSSLSETTQAGMPELPSEWDAAVNMLFADGIRPADEELCRKIDDALVSAKILDPACGSGAFPMGILLRMVELLRILRKIPEDENVYDLKLELIENCIYGVDIQCIAVQISKLRFFISLVCEEGAVLNQSSTGIPACDEKDRNTGILACDVLSETTQARMPELPSGQAGVPELPSLSISHRKLPHWKKDGAIYWITFRLADSIPQSKLKAWKESYDLWILKNPKPWDDLQWQQYNEHFGRPLEKWLDAGMGSCSLSRSDVRDALIGCMLKFDGGRLALHSAVIMPNHVHCLMELGPGEDLSAILKGIKGASARAANQILGASGKFWMDESYDHIVRSTEQYAHFRRYIRANPQKAGLNENQYWLYEGNTGILACGKEGSTGIPACDEEAQTGMSVLRSRDAQAGMPVLPCAENNYGIHTLPNLETKFVAADSLIGLPKSGDALPMANVEQLKKELWGVRHKHFRARSYREKKELRKEDRALRTALAKELRSGGGFDTASAKLMAEWDPYDQNASAAFSDPEWMFNVGTGFDVVIGNPPYVQIQKIPEEAKDNLKEQGYKTFLKTADLYCLFYEQGLNRLRPDGVLMYISSNKFFRAGYGKALRGLLNEDKELHIIIDFGELPVFEAGTDPCIITVVNHLPTSGKIRAAAIKEKSGIQNVAWTVDQIGFDLNRDGLNTDGWTLDHPGVIRLIEKLRDAGTPLGEYVDRKFYRGILTGFNEAFVIDRETRDELISNDRKSAELIKPWLRGKDIKRWHADFNDLYVINIQSSANKKWPWSGKEKEKAENIFKKEYPAVYAHLKEHKTKLTARDDQGQHYWELRSCAYSAEFDQPKIVFNETSKELHAFCDYDALFINKTGFIIVNDNLEYLLGIMNSTVMDWFYRSTFPSWGDPWNGGRVQFRGDRMDKVSIPIAEPNQQAEIESRVKKILAQKKENPDADVSILEAEIDQLVYKLYDLTPEEIAIVEGSTGILACEKKGSTGIPACAKAEKAQTGMSVLRSKKKLKPQLPPSLPGWD